MDIHLYNTLARDKQLFEPADPGRVTMYVCGPTVYSYAHIGNARPAVVFDVLFRLLREAYGPGAVLYATNITDIDDKIIAASADQGLTIPELTARYERQYLSDMEKLFVLSPSVRPRASAHIAGMIEMMVRLEADGHAYRTPAGLWFSVPSMPGYGRLSRRNRDDMIAGARVEASPDKRDPADFALWKAAKPGEPADARWSSPFGEGRPGWHIECSAMSAAVLGRTIDIHGGGLDLIFPHHENEIAQSECAHGAPMARYWLHNGFVSMDSEKMAKSLGNIRTVSQLLERHDGETLRLALLSAHYRQPLDWTEALLSQSRALLLRLYGALRRVWPAQEAAGPPPAEVLGALCDDLNTPQALAAMSALAAEANRAPEADWPRLKHALRTGGALLGILNFDPEAFARGDAPEAEAIDALVRRRFEARLARNFAEADRIRSELAAQGVEVMDGPSGSTWRRI